jgi:hypothetical protein
MYVILIDLHLGSSPYGPDEPRPEFTGPLCPISIDRPSVPHINLQALCAPYQLTGPLCPISIHGSPITLLKFQIAPNLYS